MTHPKNRSAEREDVLSRLRAWLVERNPAASAEAIQDDTDLIQGRILDSLQLVEFILYLEHLSGRTILVEGLDPDTLRTLGTIYTRYFTPEPGGAP